MKKKKEDRRMRRTRQLLRDAFTALLLEKSYDAITVQNIIDRADVARSTFYAHFLDKEDLLLGQKGIFGEDVDQPVKEKLIKEEEQESQSILPTRSLFCHVQNQHRIYKAMVGTPGLDLALQTFYALLRDDVQRKIEPYLTDEQSLAMPGPVLIDYLAGVLLILVKWWFDNDMPYSPEQMDEIFQRLAMPGVYQITGIPQPEAYSLLAG